MGTPWLLSDAYRRVVDQSDLRVTREAWDRFFEENMLDAHLVEADPADSNAGISMETAPLPPDGLTTKEWFRQNRDKWVGATIEKWISE